MRALLLALLLALALSIPPQRLLADSTQSLWQQGQQLVRRGDYTQAEHLYATLASQLGPDAVPRALLLEARAQLADGDTQSAEATLQQLLDQYPTTADASGAWFTLEQERRAAGDCAGALRALAAFEIAAGPTAIGPYAQIQRAQCLSQLDDWTGELEAASAALSIDGGGPRLAQIEALERLGEANIRLGQRQAALDAYNRALELAGTPAYRAEMLFTTATLARSLGQNDLALQRFRSVVVDLPDQARAPAALDGLNSLGAGATVSPYQAGLVRLDGKQYSAAIDLFDEVDPTTSDWGPAQLGRAEGLAKLGSQTQAERTLQSLAESDPIHAGAALLRLGQLQEAEDDTHSAEQSYLAVPAAAPQLAGEALFHAGLLRYLDGDPQGAQAAWQTGLGSGPPPPAVQAELWYWLAKTQSPSSTDTQSALQQAAATAPESFYGLRAQDALGQPAAAPPDLDTWLASLDSTAQDSADDVARLPELQRADKLLNLGLRTEVGWEVDAVTRNYVAAGDLAHLSALGNWLRDRDLPELEVQVGNAERDLVGAGNVETLPQTVQQQVYPNGFADLAAENAAAYHVDPLLVLAVMRQESGFNPRAVSRAQAMGLTQVLPDTGRTIAEHVGLTDFTPSDLYRPAVSIQFGAWFLAQLLGTYHGQVLPTLAAYNAGPGNVTRWQQQFGTDPDVLVEHIPLAETQSYVRIVYTNYWHYRALYGHQ